MENYDITLKSDFCRGPVPSSDLKMVEVQVVFLVRHKKQFLECDEITLGLVDLMPMGKRRSTA